MKPPKRPIDAQDMPWSYIGKDELDKSAEQVWEYIRNQTDADIYPYSWGSEQQETAQRAVLLMLGTTVPALLRQRVKELKTDGVQEHELYYLRDLAEELENDHG